jgi:uncharacterized protein
METLLGFGIAVLVGLTGMGGGTLCVPLLVLCFNLPAAECVATSLVYVTITKLTAAGAYIYRREVHYPTLLRLLAGGLPGVALGALVLHRLRGPQLENILLLLVGSTIMSLALFSLWRHFRPQQTRTAQHRPVWLPTSAFPIGLEVGFSSAGAGALGSIVLMFLTTLPPSIVVGTELLFGMSLAAAGSAMHFSQGMLDTALATKMLQGGIPGALIGSWLATMLPARHLRLALNFTLTFLGAQLAWRGLIPILR